MGIEHLAAVWEHSRQSGSNLVVLLAIASYSDHNGEWVIDQATLQRRTRLGNRRVRQLLAELVNAGALAVASPPAPGKHPTPPPPQRRPRLGNRRVRQLLAELVNAGELAVVSHHGRGKLSTYRLLTGQENWQPAAAFPAPQPDAGSPLSRQ